MHFEIAPDNFYVVQLGRVFRQPLDSEPMPACIERRQGHLALVDRSVVLDQHDGRRLAARLWAVKVVNLLQVYDEISAALIRARVHDELAGDMIERADDRHPSWPAPALARADRRYALPRLSPDRDG